MCQSYRKACACGQQTSEIFFGKMILDEKSIAQVYCPECSGDIDTKLITGYGTMVGCWS